MGWGKVPGSGRQRGVPNRTRAQTLERIECEADPIGFLILVARGLQFEAATEAGGTKKEKMFPSHDQRLDAAKVLARKVLPDTKAVELAAPVGGQPDATRDAEFNRWLSEIFPGKEDTESPPPRPNGLPDQDTQMGAGAEGNAAPAAAPDQQPTPS